MNRIIKFRLWDKEQKEMRTMQPNWSFSNLNAPEYIALQFTGLKDKNGKEIYEGDIVQYRWNDPYAHIGKIFWYEDGYWKIKWNNINTGKIGGSEDVLEDLLAVFVGCLEIIGNIYENPELLK